jgi:tetratricopeptide (TPR) repeat protein
MHRFSLAPAFVAFALVALCASAWAGQPPTPPANVDWEKQLADFKSDDAEKQKAAEQVFLDAGSRGFNELSALQRSDNAALVKRANELREKINQKSVQLFNEVVGLKQKIDTEPLSVPALQELQKKWLGVASYASQNAIKQNCFQLAHQAQSQIQTVQQTNKELAELDEQLKKTPPEQKQHIASLNLTRATSLRTVQRVADAIAAAQEGLAAGGQTCRHSPALLRLLAELHLQKQDYKNAEPVCQQILKDHPRSLDVKFAHSSLIEISSATQRWDEALARAKEFLTAFPVDETAQESATSLLDTLKENHDYARVGPLADWLVQTLPIDRVDPEVARYAAAWSEYLLKDLVKAERLYQSLQLNYADVMPAEEVAGALVRVKAKAGGTFGKEPAEGDEGPAGALARFLKAIRTRDAKLLVTVVPKDEAKNYEELLDSGEMIPPITFGDFILKEAKLEEDKNNATLTVDYFDAGCDKPTPLPQKAVKEDGQWKIRWSGPKAEE